jgi:hypothetical protein
VNRPEFRLEAWHFTTTSALAREILALLEVTDYKLIVQVTPPQREQLEAELESCKIMGRVKVEVVE